MNRSSTDDRDASTRIVRCHYTVPAANRIADTVSIYAMEYNMLHWKRLTAIAPFILAAAACGGGQVPSDAAPSASTGSSGAEEATSSTGSAGRSSVLTPSVATIVDGPLPKPVAQPSPTPPTGPVGGPPWPRDAEGNITQAFWESLPLNEWIEVPGTKLRQVEPPFKLPGIVGFRSIVDAWGGAAYDTKRQRMIFQGGGHSDYVGNEVLALSFRSMTVERIWGPDQPASFRPKNGNLSVDGLTGLNLTLTNNPTGAHTYRGITYIPEIDATVRLGQAISPLVFHHDVNDWDRRYHPSPVDKYKWQSGEALPWFVPSHGVAYGGKWYVFNRNWNGYVVDFSRHTIRSDGQPAYGVIEKFSYSHPLGFIATSVFIPETGEFVVFSQTAADSVPDVVVYDLDLVGRAGFSRTVELTGVRDLVYPKAANWFSPWDQVGTAWVSELGKIFVLENAKGGSNRMMVLTRTPNGFDAQWFSMSGNPPPHTQKGAFGRMQTVKIGDITVVAVVSGVDENVRIVRVR